MMMISLILLYLLVIVFQVTADTDNDSVHHRHYLRGSERGN